MSNSLDRDENRCCVVSDLRKVIYQQIGKVAASKESVKSSLVHFMSIKLDF